MDFAYSEEQDEFRRTLRRLLAERAPSDVVRKVVEGGQGGELGGQSVDAELWRQLCDQLGLPSLHVAENVGGAGFSLMETAIAMEELGRALTPVPFAATVFASVAVAALGSPEQQAELLPGLASGDRVGALAVSEPGSREWGTVALRAAPRRDSFVLRGSKAQVLSGGAADTFLVAALGDTGEAHGEPALYVVPADAPGVTVRRVETLDLTRPMAVVELEDVPAVALAGGGGTWSGVLDVLRALLAAEMVGVAERCLEMTVAYAKDRTQFNRPIGSFQAVKHRCAEMAIAVDAARAAAMYALMCAADGSPELAVVAPIAKAKAADAATFCAAWAIQLHGGIGFTWEHDAHLYLRRAKTDEVLLGSTAQQRALLADRIGI